jgi:hypothetical protein
MRRFLLAMLLTMAPLAAQEKTNEQRPAQKYVQKIFVLKYADPRVMQDVLRAFGANMQISTEMRTVAVNAPAETVEAMGEAIARLDTPAAAPKNIELTMQLVVGTESDTAGNPLPKDLEPVVTQLRGTFPFKNYRLLDVLAIRTRTGQRASTDSSGASVQSGGISRPIVSNFSINGSSLGESGTVRLDGLKCSTKMPMEVQPGNFNYQDLGMNTDVDIKEGQKVVIGRQGINREQALFLVLTARVVQ